jgi:hypothetical protein
VAPTEVEYIPATQSMHELEPAVVAYVPATHNMQAAAEVAPAFGLAEPALH